MLKNATYNLMETASVISKGLHRYGQFATDAKDCQHCQRLWEDMRRHDEQQLNQLVEHLRQHFDSERKPAAAA
jgi:hypothetical protein